MADTSPSAAAAGAGGAAGAGAAFEAAAAAGTRKARWGIISTATIADKVCPAIHAARNAEVVVVASRSREKAEAWAKSHDVPEWGTYEEVLAREDIDAVYVPLPSAVRNDWCLKAARCGKAVYTEKPLPGSVEEVKALTEACAEAGVQFMDGTMWVHSTRTRAMEKALADGAIGAVRRVTASFTFKAPDDAWRDGGNGRTDKTREPMGCFGDQGWYPIQAIMWAFGYELPERVCMTYTNLNKVDTIISAGGTLWFSGGRMATFDCGCEAAHRCQFELAGDAGVIKVNDLVGGQGRSGDFAAYELPYTGSGSYVLGDVMGKDTEVKVEPCDHAALLVERFSDAVLSGTPDASWPTRSLAAHTVMVALFKSSQEGGSIVTL